MRRKRTQRQCLVQRDREMLCTEIMASAVFRLWALWAVVWCGAARADTVDSSYSTVGTRNRASASTGSLFDGLAIMGSLFSDSSLSGGLVAPGKTGAGIAGSSLSGGFFGSSNNGLGFSSPSLSRRFQGSNILNSGFSGSLHSGGFLESKQGGLSSFSGHGQLGTAALNLQRTLPREHANSASNFFSSGQVLNSRFANQKTPLLNSGFANRNSNIFSNNHHGSQPIVLASRGLGLRNSNVQSFQSPPFNSAQSNSIFTGKSSGGLLQRQNTRHSSFGGSSSNFGSDSFSSHVISTDLASQNNIQKRTNLGFGPSSGSTMKLNFGSGQKSTFSSGVGNRNVFSGRASQIRLLPTTTKLVAAGSGFQFVQYPSGFDTGLHNSKPGVGFLPGGAATSKFVGIGNTGNRFGGIVGAFESGKTGNLYGSAGAGVFGSTVPGSPFALGNIGTFGMRNTGNRFGSGNIGTFDLGHGNKLGSGNVRGSGTGFFGTLSASGGANRLGLTRFPEGTFSSDKNLSGTFVGDRKYLG